MKFKNIVKIALVVILLAGISISFSVQKASANPFSIPQGPCTAAATSTLSVMAASLGTTTLTYDSYGAYNGCSLINTAQPVATEKAALLLQATSIASTSVINFTFQYSQDNIDWYDDTFAAATTSAANQVSLVSPASYTWTNIQSATTTSKRVLNFNTPTRYTRVTFSTLVATSSIWATIIPQRQVKE